MNAAQQNSQPTSSPLSSSPPKKIRDLSKAFILKELEDYYGARPSDEAVECDYALWECGETGLQFAWPMLPGNSLFYEWLAGFSSYYPGKRWEYDAVRRLIGPDASVLDVGCGKGDFLRSLDSLPLDRRFALDMNAPAIEECRRQKFPAFCGTIESAVAAGFFKPAQFAVVTAFHCLEHVSDPVGFVRSLMKATAPGGSVFVSTPYSPMSFESEWFDVMNHPPHHMTRWNLSAYQRLATLLGARMQYFTPPSAAARRALNAFQLVHYGPNRRVGKGRLFRDLLGRLPEFARFYSTQRRRGPIVSDVILVQLTIP